MSESGATYKKELADELGRLEKVNRETEKKLSELTKAEDPLASRVAELLKLSRSLEMHTRELLTGSGDRKNVFMREAISTACVTQELEDWMFAMEALYERSLEATRPAFFAGSVLGSLRGVVIPGLALPKLVSPLLYERSLETPGYEWDWTDETSDKIAKDAWLEAERITLNIAQRHLGSS